MIERINITNKIISFNWIHHKRITVLITIIITLLFVFRSIEWSLSYSCRFLMKNYFVDPVYLIKQNCYYFAHYDTRSLLNSTQYCQSACFHTSSQTFWNKIVTILPIMILDHCSIQLSIVNHHASIHQVIFTASPNINRSVRNNSAFLPHLSFHLIECWVNLVPVSVW